MAVSIFGKDQNPWDLGVEIGSEDEQDKTDLQVGCLTMLLFYAIYA